MADVNAQNRDEDTTRDRLIATAVRLFGQYGFDGVSTRTLTEEADANISAIKYYFGDKQGLYEATLKSMTAEVRRIIDPILETFTAGIHDAHGDRQVLIRVTRRFMTGLVHALLSNPQLHDRLSLFVRELSHPSQYFDIYYEGIPKLIHEAMSELIGAASGRPVDDKHVIIRAHTAIGQLMVFLFGRVIIMKRLDWSEITPDRIDMVSEEITNAVLRNVFAPSIEG